MNLWESTPHHIFLFNFGGPTNEEEVKPFLQNLFKDPFILKAPLGNFLRQKLANYIANKRWHETNKAYKQIGYSPINEFTKRQAADLEEELKKIYPLTKVHVVNRYTAPRSIDVLRGLDLKDSRNFFLTLYPHLSHSTVVSSYREFDLSYVEWHGNKDFIATKVYSFWNHPKYMSYYTEKLWDKISQVTASMKSQEKLTVIYSAHGLPKKYYDRGDPYIDETKAQTLQLTKAVNYLATKHNLEQQFDFHLGFQSRVGPVEWTKPYTEKLIKELGKKNKGSLLLVPISFTSDHIETTYEMDILYKDLALKHGFEKYERLTPSNNDPKFTECLKEILISGGF